MWTALRTLGKISHIWLYLSSSIWSISRGTPHIPFPMESDGVYYLYSKNPGEPSLGVWYFAAQQELAGDLKKLSCLISLFGSLLILSRYLFPASNLVRLTPLVVDPQTKNRWRGSHAPRRRPLQVHSRLQRRTCLRDQQRGLQSRLVPCSLRSRTILSVSSKLQKRCLYIQASHHS